jgi:molybdopterin-guanine dinucleotide biosynthesis protein A
MVCPSGNIWLICFNRWASRPLFPAAPNRLPPSPRFVQFRINTPDSGPLGAIASAFAEDSFAAWLVIACDMPLVDHAVLQYLLNSRRPDFAATAFRSPSLPGDTPDPLLAIWEPAVLPVLKSSMKKGNKSVHRVLTTAGVFLLEPPDPAVLTNTNMPEEMAMIDPFLKEIFLLH